MDYKIGRTLRALKIVYSPVRVSGLSLSRSPVG